MVTAVDLGDGGDRNHQKMPIEVFYETVHQICTDPWYQVGFVLTTGINSSYILWYSAWIMVPLGGIGVVVGMLLVAAISFYANVLVARLHNAGGERQIRYRDLAGNFCGRKMYYLTWALQYVNFFMINTGYIILAGQALKAIYVLYWYDGAMKLPYCIAIAGVVCALFAFGIPNLSALRIWLIFSTILNLVYIAIIAFVLSLRDGLNSQKRDYNIPTSHWDNIAISAAANLVFSYNTGMLPEIQAKLFNINVLSASTKKISQFYPLKIISQQAKILNTSSFVGAPVNWKETPNAYVFWVDLPGISREEIKVEVEDESVLQISRERKRENEESVLQTRERASDTWHSIECSSGTFLRRFCLPENAKLADAKVSLDNNVLTVFVPKARAKKAGVRSLKISIPVVHHIAAL